MESAPLPRRMLAENELDDIAEFLARWDTAANGRPAQWYNLIRSAYGNVNSSGQPGDYVSPDLTPKDGDWGAAIEPGIRPVVDVLVSRMGLVTYSSCEGHRYPTLDLPPAVRYVGVLPRSRQEAERVEALFVALEATASKAAVLPPGVRLVSWSNELSCAATGARVPVFDVSFEPTADWEVYFAALVEATRLTCETLIGIDTGNSCR